MLVSESGVGLVNHERAHVLQPEIARDCDAREMVRSAHDEVDVLQQVLVCGGVHGRILPDTRDARVPRPLVREHVGAVAGRVPRRV